MGAQALHGHDTIHGSDDWAAVGERWAQTLDEEYLTPDGSYAHIRSNHIGVSWDTGEVPGGHYHANGTHRFADILPDHARRARRSTCAAGAEDGDAVEHRRRRHARPRTAPRARAAPHLVELAAAVDQDHRRRPHGGRRAADRRVDRRVGSQVRTGSAGRSDRSRSAAPASARTCCCAGRRRSTSPSFAIRGWVEPVGPLVEADADTLITLARSDDGVTLQLALEPVAFVPGTDATGSATLRFTHLTPGTHRLRGSVSAPGAESRPDEEDVDVTVEADADGNATVRIPLAAPVRLTLDGAA